jgi:hypothetical protein
VWPVKIRATFGGNCPQFSVFFLCMPQKITNRRKLFGTIFDGFSQAVENSIDLFSTIFFLAAENYSVTRILHIPFQFSLCIRRRRIIGATSGGEKDVDKVGTQ